MVNMSKSVKAAGEKYANNSNQEMEVKFLLKRLPKEIVNLPHKDISQGYLDKNNPNVIALVKEQFDSRFDSIDMSKIDVVRVRKETSLNQKNQPFNEYSLTLKGLGLFVRSENEISVSESVFNQCWDLATKGKLAKRRYEDPLYINGEKFLIEIDEYSGKQEETYTVEIEIKDPQLRKYLLHTVRLKYNLAPDQITDVTEDPKYKNNRMAAE